jgi:hypothetical protein
VAIGRSDDGRQFGDILQIYADGTLLDSGGVHHLGQEAIRPLVQVLQSNDFTRLKGHCGGPPTDFVEQVHVVVYDRSRGRLRAHSFSHSGNAQGCDPALRQLQAVVESLQTKLTGPAPAPSLGDAPPAPPLATSVPPSDAKVITLTPP